MLKDMTGLRFGRLSVYRAVGKDKRGEYLWLCKCDCGAETIVRGNKLRSGTTKSCGCYQREHRKKGFHKTHGMANTRLYIVWCNMRHRCYNPKNDMYSNYGGRGIVVCDEWKKSFETFLDWAKKSGYSDGLSLERNDVNGNYEPDNCKWIALNEQSLNKRTSHRITAFGETKTIKEWSDSSGIKYDTIERRINLYGWTAEEAVTLKPHERRR